jgi:hypothetical protein
VGTNENDTSLPAASSALLRFPVLLVRADFVRADISLISLKLKSVLAVRPAPGSPKAH